MKQKSDQLELVLSGGQEANFVKPVSKRKQLLVLSAVHSGTQLIIQQKQVDFRSSLTVMEEVAWNRCPSLQLKHRSLSHSFCASGAWTWFNCAVSPAGRSLPLPLAPGPPHRAAGFSQQEETMGFTAQNRIACSATSVPQKGVPKQPTLQEKIIPRCESQEMHIFGVILSAAYTIPISSSFE